ncbi:MAG TPA: aminomethyl-transferring glycine dehydrogenase subunit GcvPA [Actinomycetota bacterium]|nr:aminomethyl-transferring glycine dehydrogenase subunit GcvPA [Actinomycetota bacterium]
MKFTPHTGPEIEEMLSSIGVASLDGLFDQIPSSVRLDGPLGIPEGVSELEIVEDLGRLAGRSRHLDDLVCFAGAGAYDHYIPSVVWALAGRSEFSTAYTPYQPELSQGILQTLFEFQSMICELTGLEVSNASLYDGATALVEAVNMARTGERGRVLVSEGVDPRLLETLRTYGRGPGYEPETFAAEGGRGGSPVVGDDVAAVIVQHPNVLGILEPATDLFATAREGGAKAIQVFDPLSLGVLAPPGELGADIAVAEGQALGNHLAFGGPYLGLIAARMGDVRRMPGRIVGETADLDGAPGYVLTLQAREQHIRREKANSNICTNQTLMAIAATIYLGWLGPEGLAELGRQCAAKASYAAARLTELPGVSLVHPDAPFFKEFALRVPGRADQVVEGLVEHGYLGGVAFPRAGEDVLLVAVTERRTREQIDGLVDALGTVIA